MAVVVMGRFFQFTPLYLSISFLPIALSLFVHIEMGTPTVVAQIVCGGVVMFDVWSVI